MYVWSSRAVVCAAPQLTPKNGQNWIGQNWIGQNWLWPKLALAKTTMAKMDWPKLVPSPTSAVADFRRIKGGRDRQETASSRRYGNRNVFAADFDERLGLTTCEKELFSQSVQSRTLLAEWQWMESSTGITARKR